MAIHLQYWKTEYQKITFGATPMSQQKPSFVQQLLLHQNQVPPKMFLPLPVVSNLNQAF